jgi:hypothetical protein
MSRLREDIVGADASPDNVHLSVTYGLPILKCSPSVGCPRHFEYARRSLDTLDTQAGSKSSAAQIGHKAAYSSLECLLFRQCEVVIVP